MATTKIWHTNPDGSKVYHFEATCPDCGKRFETPIDPDRHPNLACVYCQVNRQQTR
jgi:hypothetical protein